MKFSELVNIDELSELCESYTAITGAVTALLELDGTILLATGWQDICTRFHRVNEATACRCRESDTILAGGLTKGEPYNVYKCKNGLIDVAVPIMIRGEHVANFFTGQFFSEPPDREYFIHQAEVFGFDRDSYLEALQRVPVFTEETVKTMMKFFIRLAQLIGEMGLARKEIEESNKELRVSEERLKLATHAANIGIWDWDVLNNRLSWDEGMYNLYGISREDFNGVFDAWTGTIHPEDRLRVETEIRSALSGEREYSPEFRIICPNGAVRFIKAASQTFFDDNGTPFRMIGANIDITDRIQAEKDLLLFNEELEQRVTTRTAQLEAVNKELEAFSYSISHDLRAPLRHINGFIELLGKQDTRSLNEKSRHYLQVIAESARKMGTLIDDLLSFSRMGRVEIMQTPVSMAKLVTEAQNELQSDLIGKTIVWEIGSLPEVYGDPAMLRQVLINLISNAVNYSRGRDPIKIAISCSRSDETDETICRVSDNGSGFDMRYVDKLFGLFQRLHSSEEFEGTGVGLANVSRIIQRHGGRTWAEGVVNGGATFYFSLPDRKEHAPWKLN